MPHALIVVSLLQAGEALADEVRAARAAKLEVAMVHENDPALDGCEFARCVVSSV